MAIQMTRKEYEAKYGVAPAFQRASDMDTSPAPRAMTRAEYELEFNPVTPAKGGIFGPTKEALQGLKTTYGGEEDGIAMKLKDNVSSASKDIVSGKGFKGAVKAGFRTAADVAGLLYAPIGVAVQATGFGRFSEFVGEKVAENNPLTDSPAVQRFAMTHPNAGEDFGRALNLLLAKSERSSKIEPSTVVARTGDQVKLTGEKVLETKARVTDRFANRSVDKLANEINAVENNYSKLRKANDFANDSGSKSRQRIAQTDVLVDSVDSTGTMRTTQKGGAVDLYRKQTINGAEGVVRDNLVREKGFVNINEVAKRLTLEADKIFEGVDLVSALKGVSREIEGLRLRADELGNIPLEKIQDSKIGTTRNINYMQDANSTVSFKKAKAFVYKKIIEEKSKFKVEVNGKQYGVIEINAELAPYMGDLERLANLDGKKVRGGKLGKYSAQLSGNLIGGAAGAMFGPAGAALGGAIGGEAAGFIKGKVMSNTFGKAKGTVAPENAILSEARKAAGLPAEVNLKVADLKLGSPKGIVKTKEILQIEGQIKRNVDAQKTAIKANDFALVKSLKEVYVVLVSALKEIIQKIKDTPNQKGGFVRIEGTKAQSKSDGSLKVQYNKTNTKINTSIDKTVPLADSKASDLSTEAKKYKTSEDFIANKTKTVFVEDSKGFTMEIPSIDAENLNLKSNEYWHGSTGKLFQEFKPNTPVFMTKDSGFANYYPKQQKGSNYAKVFKVTVPENARFFDATKDFSKLINILPEKVELAGLFGARKTISSSEFVDGLKQGSAWSEYELSSAGGKQILKYIKEAGFDGVKMKEMGDDTFALFSPSKAKTTKSQLEQIWKDSNKK